MIRRTLALLMAGIALAGAPASAATTILAATLRGNAERPPVETTGTGNAVVTLDDVANTLRVQIMFSSLRGNTTASHIHCCQPIGTNAGVATAVPTFPDFPLGVTSGSYDRTFDMTQASSFNPAFITNHGGTVDQARADLFAGMLASQSYLNVHTSLFPGGEIRGQLIPQVPEPASWALMIAGFGLLGGALRVRRAAAITA